MRKLFGVLSCSVAAVGLSQAAMAQCDSGETVIKFAHVVNDPEQPWFSTIAHSFTLAWAMSKRAQPILMPS